MRPSTKSNYRLTLDKCILPHLGPILVCDLTPGQVEHAVKAWTAAGQGVNTVRSRLGQLRGMLNAARRVGLITSNPATDAKGPKAKRKTINPFSVEELDRIITTATSGRSPLWIYAALAATGMRLGEATALDVGDYNPATGQFVISKTYTRQHGIRSPKSEYGNRTIEVPEAARAAIVKAIAGRKSGPLFAVAHHQGGITGRKQHGSVQRSWANFLKRLDLAHRNLHQLRHSVATVLIAAGEPIGDVAKYLGDTVETVVKNYLHPTGTNPAATMNRLFAGVKGGRKVGDGEAKSRSRLKKSA